MKLIVDVDEADIGNVRVGQTANFRVDAYPDRSFSSKVSEVRSTPKTSNGVVTYQTVLAVDNSERLLQPGMTATAEITVTHVEDVLLVPNAALRYPRRRRRSRHQEGAASVCCHDRQVCSVAIARSKMASRACGGCPVLGSSRFRSRPARLTVG